MFNKGDRVKSTHEDHKTYYHYGTVMEYIEKADHYMVKLDYGDIVYGKEGSWELVENDKINTGTPGDWLLNKKQRAALIAQSHLNISDKDEVIGRLIAIIENILSDEGLAHIVDEDMPDWVHITCLYKPSHIKDYSML